MSVAESLLRHRNDLITEISFDAYMDGGAMAIEKCVKHLRDRHTQYQKFYIDEEAFINTTTPGTQKNGVWNNDCRKITMLPNWNLIIAHLIKSFSLMSYHLIILIWHSAGLKILTMISAATK